MLVCDKCGVALIGGKDTYGSYGRNLCSGCYLPKVPEFGYTALIRAAERGDYSSVEKLIQYGADVNAKNEQLDTALILVSCKGHIELAALLLSHGADPNQRNLDGSTALDEAICKDKKDLVKLLLVNGADPNLKGRPSGIDGLSCLTTLGLAVMKRSLPLVNILLHYNADPNERMSSGGTALYAAAADGCGAIVNALLKSGADADIRAYNNLKPIDIAIRNHCTEVVELLKKEVVQQSLLDEQTHELQEKHDEKPAQQESRAKVNGEKFALGKIAPQNTAAQDTAKEAEPHTVPQISPQSLLSKLNELTGLSQIKSDVTQIVNFLRVQKLRKDKGLSVPEQSLHMVFTGNPGTGKTTIARLIAQIYKNMGILSKGQFVETDRAGLVGGYLGQTAIKTQEVVESALGGVLFIDEAYSLTDSTHGHDMYGQEAVATLLKLMEDHRDDLIVIVAGYTEPMQKFIRSNPGLQSRFNKFLHFDDYAPAELTEIFGYFALQGDYNLHPATELKLHNVFADLYARRDETFGNARLARNMFEKAINAHANRMVSAGMVDEASLVTLYPEDVPNG